MCTVAPMAFGSIEMYGVKIYTICVKFKLKQSNKKKKYINLITFIGLFFFLPDPYQMFGPTSSRLASSGMIDNSSKKFSIAEDLRTLKFSHLIKIIDWNRLLKSHNWSNSDYYMVESGCGRAVPVQNDNVKWNSPTAKKIISSRPTSMFR